MNRAWPWAVRLVGLAVIIQQAAFAHVDRPYLMGAALLMMAGIDAIEKALEKWFDRK